MLNTPELNNISSKIIDYIAEKAILIVTGITLPSMKTYKIAIRKENIKYTLNQINIIESLIQPLKIKYRIKDLKPQQSLIQINITFKINKIKINETLTTLKLYKI